MFESPDVLVPVYANHAHDDWLEIWLEGGWLALAIAGAFVVWLVRAINRRWRTDWPNETILDRSISRAGAIIVPLLMLHSVVDYPLRTTALMCVAAFACALLVQPAGRRRDSNEADAAEFSTTIEWPLTPSGPRRRHQSRSSR
jgi:O-antigen ligase